MEAPKASDIVIRNIKPQDVNSVFAIRNLPSEFKYFRNARKVAREEHARWFTVQLQPEKRKFFFVAVQSGKIVGYLRYDAVGDVYDISIAVIPEFQKKGIGSLMLHRTLSKIAADGKEIQAEVQKENVASLKFFEKHGFVQKMEKNHSTIFIWVGTKE